MFACAHDARGQLPAGAACGSWVSHLRTRGPMSVVMLCTAPRFEKRMTRDQSGSRAECCNRGEARQSWRSRSRQAEHAATRRLLDVRVGLAIGAAVAATTSRLRFSCGSSISLGSGLVAGIARRPTAAPVRDRAARARARSRRRRPARLALGRPFVCQGRSKTDPCSKERSAWIETLLPTGPSAPFTRRSACVASGRIGPFDATARARLSLRR